MARIEGMLRAEFSNFTYLVDSKFRHLSSLENFSLIMIRATSFFWGRKHVQWHCADGWIPKEEKKT